MRRRWDSAPLAPPIHYHSFHFNASKQRGARAACSKPLLCGVKDCGKPQRQCLTELVTAVPNQALVHSATAVRRKASGLAVV